MPLAYGQVKDLYDTLHDAGVISTPLPDWASEMNRITGSDLYSAGLHDNLIKRSSHALDKLLEESGLVHAGQEFGRAFGEVVGAPEEGAAIGAGLPRTTVNFAPMMIPGAGWGAAAARFGLTGLLSGAHTYTETGSPAAGLVSGVTAAALPKVTDVAEQALLSRIGGRLVEGPLADVEGNVLDQVRRFFPETVPQKLAAFATGQGVAAAALEGSGAAQALLQGETPQNPLSVETLLNLTLGQLPFAALHLGTKIKGGEKPADKLQHAVDVSAKLIERRQAENALKNRPGVDNIPDYTQGDVPDPKVIQEITTRLSQVRGEQVKAENDLTLTPEERIEAINRSVNEEAELLKRRDFETGQTVLGDTIVPQTERTPVVGKEVARNKDGTWRAVLVSDDESNPPELRGKVVGYSTLYEPNPIFGVQTQETGVAKFSLPPAQWRTPHDVDVWFKRRPTATNQPELPIQAREPTREEMFGHITDLENVEADIDAAETTGDLHQAITKINDVKAQTDLSPTTDKTLRRKARSIEATGLVAPEEVVKVAAKSEARDAKRKLTRREREREVAPASQGEAAQVAAEFGEGAEVQRGFSIITPDKLSHAKVDDVETKPVSDVITDTAEAAVASFDGRRAAEGQDRGQVAKDANDFVDLVEHFKTTEVDPKKAAEFLNDRFGTSGWDEGEVKSFLEKPYVKVWKSKFESGLRNLAVKAPAPARVSAGPGWIWGLKPLEGIRGLSKEGVMPTGRFRNSVSDRGSMSEAEFGLLKTIVPEAFKEDSVDVRKLYQLLPERGPVVEVKKSGKPTTGEPQNPELAQLQHEFYDNLSEDYQSDIDHILALGPTGDAEGDASFLRQAGWMFNTIPQALRYIELRRAEAPAGWNAVGGRPTYAFVAPKHESEMPGYVEGLVRLAPSKALKENQEWVKQEGIEDDPLNPPDPEDVEAFDKSVGVRYRGPHFGSEDTDILAFYRGYEETLPDGTKAFHVIEVQSDWGQKVRDMQGYKNEGARSMGEMAQLRDDGWHYNNGQMREDIVLDKSLSRQEVGAQLADKIIGKQYVTEGHPLLRVYETLALKAAIQHAKEVGATKVILSDAETAMMTEGHDRVAVHGDAMGNIETEVTAGWEQRVKDAGYTLRSIGGNDWEITGRDGLTAGSVEGGVIQGATPEVAELLRPGGPRPTQEKGMRLHYDQTLPSAMEKLTGERGQQVDLGTHKATIGTGPGDIPGGTLDEASQILNTRVSGSPVFRDASGQPKTQITGRMYDISKTGNEFTLTDPSRAPGGATSRVPEEPFVPTTDEERSFVEQMKTGTGMIEHLKKSELPIVRALAEDLSQYASTLQRISGRVVKTDGVAYARRNTSREAAITFNHGLISSDPYVRDYTIAHELIHGLTMTELDNPVKAHIVRGMDNLRREVINLLPKDIRKFYDKAVENNWIDKYGSDLVSFESLAPTHKTREIVYSLLDLDEFVSGGFTNEHFRDFLRKTPATKKEGGWFHKFTSLVKELLGIEGKVDGTLFEEFMSRTSQLLQNGEYVSSFHNFSENFYKNLGFSDIRAASQTQRALGLIISTDHGFTPEGVFDVLDYPTQTQGRSPEYLLARRNFDTMQKERGDDFILHAKAMDELGFGLDQGGVHDLALGLLRGEVEKDSLDVLPDQTTKFLFAKIKDFREVLASVKAASAEKNEGFINLADPIMIRRVVADASKMLENVLGVEREHQEAARIVNELQSIPPDGYLNSFIGRPVRAPDKSPVWMEDADQTKRSFGKWVKDFLQPVGQLAREIPEAAEILSKGFQLPANQRKMISEALKPFGLDYDSMLENKHEWSKESVHNMEQAMRNPKIQAATNKWIYLNQIKGKETDGVTLLPENDVDVTKALQGLSTQERRNVTEIVTKHQLSQQIMQAQVLEKMLQVAATHGASIASKDNGHRIRDNITLSDALIRAVTIDRSDPSAAQQADAQIALVQSKMSPEGFLQLLRYSQSVGEQWKLMQEFYQKNPAWSSGQRYGKFLVEFVKGNKTYLMGVESKKEADEVAKGGRVIRFERNRRDEEDQPPSLGPDGLGLITRLRELETNQHDMLRGSLSESDIELLRQTSPIEQLATEEAYRGGVPNLRPKPRGLTKGAEELPWLSNHFSWVNKTSTYWSRQLLRAQARVFLLDPEIAQDAKLQKKLKTHFDNILHPDPEFAQHVNRFTTTWFMGFNPASAMVNATQPFLTHVAELTSMTGKPLQSYRRVLSALDEAKQGIGNREWKDSEIQWLMTEAAKDGEQSYSMFDTDAALDEAIATNYKRVLSGERTKTLGQQIGTASGAYTKAGLAMFKMVEHYNNKAALIASFRYYREQGLGREEARDKAYEFNHAVNFGGGRAQRPIGAFSGRGTFPRSTAMIATALQSYVLGTTFQLGRYIQRGYFRPVGVTPHEVYAARRAATQMLATQLFSAGVLGLPFVSGALALLNTAFPDLELNRKVRELGAEFFASDKENGSIFSDVAMTGVPSMFGWDLQSRLSMGNTVPGVSEVNGFQPELLLGAPANLVSTFVKGATQLAQGNLSAGAEAFVPSALKKITEFGLSGGAVKDYRGRPVFDPTRGETLGIALGFQPKRLGDFNAATRIAKQTEDVTSRRVGQFHQQQAEDVLKGNFGTVRQAILSRSQQDSAYNPLDGVRAVARAAEELTFSRDLRREGGVASASARGRLLSALRIDPQQASEVARLQFRTEIERRLGLPSQPDHSQLALAQMMDQMKQQVPEATRAELRRQAERLVRRQRQQTLLELPE